MSEIEYKVTVEGKVVRLGVPYKLIGNINTSEGFTQFVLSKRFEENNIFEEICLCDDLTENYVYFKSSKLLRLHGIAFMITLFNKKKDKFKFSLAFEKSNKLKLKHFAINNLPFEIKREYFVTDVEDLEQMKRGIRNRILFEVKDTRNKLNRMSVFK